MSKSSHNSDVSIVPEADADLQRNPGMLNMVGEPEQRSGSEAIEASGRSVAGIDIQQLSRDEKDGPKSSRDVGGVQKHRMDELTLSDRVEKLVIGCEHLEKEGNQVMGHDYVDKVKKCAAQKDDSAGFGGEFGVQSDGVEKAVVGCDHMEKEDNHESQECSKGFGEKFEVEVERQGMPAVGWDRMKVPQKYESQLDHKEKQPILQRKGESDTVVQADAMSIEDLPIKLLLKIFSYLPRRKHLALVNQRWNHVIGLTVALKLSLTTGYPDDEGIYFEDTCIPMEILSGSVRKYSKFRFNMSAMGPKMMSEDFGTVLQYCRQRWSLNSLYIYSDNDQLILFLKHLQHFLHDAVKAEIRVSVYEENSDPWFDDEDDTHFVLQMPKLQQLNLFYDVSSFLSLRLEAPMLEFLKVTRCRKLRLKLHECTKLHTANIWNIDGTSRSDPGEVKNILPQAPIITRFEIRGFPIQTTFMALFGKLQTIVLRSVKITPTVDPLECVNLENLQLFDVDLRKPLKLRVPQLRTLICDDTTLRSLQLTDTFKADRLGINTSDGYSGCSRKVSTVPVGLAGFSRVQLLIKGYSFSPGDNLRWIWPYLTGLRELTLQPLSSYIELQLLDTICTHFPQIKTLRLLKMEVPGNFSFLPASVQNVSLVDCTSKGCTIEFPPSVERVRVHKLWKPTSNPEMSLLPPDRYPLESETVLVKVNCEMVSRIVYSTKGHEPDDMENISNAMRSLMSG